MSKKNTIDNIRNVVESVGYTLLSTEYVDAKHKLDLLCDNGHHFEMKYNNFQQGQRCPVCNKSKSLPINEVRLYIEKNNCELLSTEYINAKHKLDLLCDKGHHFKQTFREFKQFKRRCPICANNIKHSYKYIKDSFEQFGYKLLSTEYINSLTKLKIQCDKGHNYTGTFANFQTGKRCPVCWAQSTTSKAEKEICDYIKTIYNDIIIENDRSTIMNRLTKKYLELDIYLPKLRKAIEYNGTYWHDNRYSKIKDEMKVIQCKEMGIDLLVINEKDWDKNWNYINSFITNGGRHTLWKKQ